MAIEEILLIGIGNEYRGDDGVGRVIARQIATRHLPGTVVEEASGEGAALMELWQKAPHVYLFDAVASGGAAGTIYRIEAHRETVPTGFFNYSTHAFSVAEAIELGRSLDTLPEQLVLYGIEGLQFEHGLELSEEVAKAARIVVDRVIDELDNTSRS